jgi:hypothetical protein
LHWSEAECDVELLQLDDMDEAGPGVSQELESEQRLYVCQMARLSIICEWPRTHLLEHPITRSSVVGKIITSRYAARQSPDEGQSSRIEQSLDEFRAELPSVLHYRGLNAETGQGLWSAMILMAYK